MEALMQEAAGTPEEAQHLFYSVGAGFFLFAYWTASIASLLGILSMTLVVAPNLTQRCSTALRERNIRSFFLGIPTLLVMGGVTAVSLQVPLLGAVAAVLSGVTLVMAFAAASEDIGRRLFWACGKEGSRATHLAVGWLVFAFGALFPVIGWFLILPYVTISGVGSLVVGALSSHARPAEIEFPRE
jgi:hypothetical protein